jgi:hypothetical protein
MWFDYQEENDDESGYGNLSGDEMSEEGYTTHRL